MKLRKIFLHTYQQWICVGTILFYLVALTGCDIEDALPECNYNTRIDYYYARDGQLDVLPQHIHQLSDYLFDANKILIQIDQRSSRSMLGYKGLQLPAGSYTMVSWGNQGAVSPAIPAKVGETTLTEMMLYLDNPYNATSRAPVDTPQGWHKNGDKLYFGTCGFTVETVGISRGRIDMAHSHLRLGITVKWKRNAPSNTLSYYMQLGNIAGAYRFTAKYELPNPYLPHGYAPSFYAIPHQGTARVNHRIDTQMGSGRSLRGEFYTLRLTDSDHPIFRLYGDGALVMKEIDLHKYFTTMQIKLDQNLRQEFDLVMEVQPDGTVIVSPLKINDWNEGESIGTTT